MATARSAPRVLLALTSHGLGHLTRSLAVARALRGVVPDLELSLATTIPAERIRRDLPAPFELRSVDFEPGTLQQSCFETDVEGTRQAYRRFMSERDERLDREIRCLREWGCSGVIADIPALPVRAAAGLGIPAIGLGNFTWDWILEPIFAGTPQASIPEILAADYQTGTAHLRLPFGPETSPFPRVHPAPLVGRRATLSGAVARERLGLPEDGRRLVVVCPGGWSPDAWSAIHVPGCDGLRFVTVGDLPVTADAPLLRLPHDLPGGVGFPDLVAAADLVLAKPGYGIASECVLHRTALVNIERRDFREAPLLIEELARLGPSAEIRLEDFFAGRWEPALRGAFESATPWAPIEEDAATRVAEQLADLLGLDRREAPARPDAEDESSRPA